MKIEVKIWVDGEEIELAPSFRSFFEKHAKKARKDAVDAVMKSDVPPPG
jgi:hypothetical protein